MKRNETQESGVTIMKAAAGRVGNGGGGYIGNGGGGIQMARNEPHVPSRCRCGGSARIEHDFCMLEVKARMRCTTCDRHTAWAPTIWQAYADWEDMADESAVRERLRKAQR